MRFLLVFFFVVFGLSIGACSDEADGRKRHIDVFVAASLADSAEEMAKQLEAQYPDYDFEINVAGSQLHAARIRQGAGASVFLSADATITKALLEEGKAERNAALCSNELVLAVREDSAIKSVADLANKDVRIVLAAKEVPVGAYAHAALKELELEEAVKDKVVSEESSVAQIVLKLLSGAADAGFVYATDFKKMKGFRGVDLGKASTAVQCGIADLDGSKLAKIFYDFALSESGQKILQEHGFIVK